MDTKAVTRRSFVKQMFLKMFSKFTGKNLQLRPQAKACKSIEKETLAQLFSCEFCKKFYNTLFFIEHFRWLPLIYIISPRKAIMFIL